MPYERVWLFAEIEALDRKGELGLLWLFHSLAQRRPEFQRYIFSPVPENHTAESDTMVYVTTNSRFSQWTLDCFTELVRHAGFVCHYRRSLGPDTFDIRLTRHTKPER